MSRIRETLIRLYGTRVELVTEVEDLMERFRRRLRPPRDRPSPRFVLITYGDQLQEPGVAPLRTLGSFLANHLGEGAAVHILPFYPSSSDDGFSVMDYEAIDPALGTWNDVDELARRFDLMFDAVFNHASVQGVWFRRFLRQESGWETAFFTVPEGTDLSAVIRPRTHPLLTCFETAAGPRQVWTTFSADQADLNFSDPRVFVRVLAVLLFYIERGARMIRLDAIAFLWKIPGTRCLHLEQTHDVIRLWRAVLDDVAPWVRLITETNVPHRDNISYFGDGTDEAHLVYNFALPPLVFHTLRTGSAGALREWARTLALPSPSTSWFNFLASHDGIGLNPARGILSPEEIEALVRAAENHGGFVSYKTNPDGSQSPYELNINYFDALSDPASDEPEELGTARFLAAHAILLSLQGLPAIYFHSFFGSRGDRAGAMTSGIPRRINREKLGRTRLEDELAEPGGRRATIMTRLQKLLEVRAAYPAFGNDAPQVFPDAPDGLFVVERGGGEAICLVNVTGSPLQVAPWHREGTSVYGTPPDQPLPAYGVSWLVRKRDSSSAHPSPLP